ncbi:transcriptional regulator [Longispora fulva]|uniref:Transcriptional regulator with XRE-family HTH domain n=1 Tax=Longispora fulva TaxID=619741 RepID=A0A8J7GI95_9ACTN|nr:helix-turn-helix transcriptional regulator [Longispora fulva]MBG6141153.1 transcriptional regulator with XRE-family HTH domain [Longispora fulva]GIG63691.1 transcriptional regulator [Longispora fulva]
MTTSPLVRGRRLASELKELRTAAGLSSTELGSKLSKSRMTVSRLETAKERPNVADVREVLDALGVTGDRWHALIKMASDAAERGWWEAFSPHMGERQQTYANLESGALTICEYQGVVVPGLLQTPDYTRARTNWARIQGNHPPRYSSEKAIEARAFRQRMLDRPDGPRYEVVLEEVAVRRLAASPDVMSAQLRHVADTAEHDPRIRVLVLPVRVQIADNWLPSSSFSLYTYPDGDPDVAAVDTETADLIYTERDQVAPYAEIYRRMRDAALSESDSIAVLRDAADEVLTRDEKRAHGT